MLHESSGGLGSPAPAARSTAPLARTLLIALAGLLLPFLWPGVLPNLLSTAGFVLERHDAHWPAALTTLHVGSDLVIGLAYTFISSLLAYIVVQNRRALPFDWVVLAFGLFIVACGLTHFMHVLVRYQPVYWLDAYVRALTAIVSIATAVALPPLVPRVRQLLTAERRVVEQQRELEATNAALREAVAYAHVLATLGDALQTTRTVHAVASTAAEHLAAALHADALEVTPADERHPRVTWGLVPPPSERGASGGTEELGEYTVIHEPILSSTGRVAGGIDVWRSAARGAWTSGQRDLMRRAAATINLALERAGAIEETERQRDALQHANTQLSRSNAELEQFAYVASHDLQAPIRAVTSFADVIEQKYGEHLDERGKAYVRQVVENGRHMKQLVDDLLTFSRLTSGRRALQPVDAAQVFDAVAARLHFDVERAGGSLTRGALPIVTADAQQLDQVLQNLVSNGLKYRREGVPPRVHVTAERDGASWRFAVSDNGLGIEEQYFERIFVIFQRLHTRTEFEGTGIGLAVCKKIVERHGGRLWVQSRAGHGSTFFFTVPAE